MWRWVSDHKALVAAVSVLSVLTAVGSLILLPWLVANWPEDRFLPGGPKSTRLVGRHPLLRVLLAVLRNTLGVLLILGGLLMLVLPGQGLLTILLGLLLVDFPGKLDMERRLVARPRVLRALNWLRRKAGRPPFRTPESVAERPAGAGAGPENMQDEESEGMSDPNDRKKNHGLRHDEED